MARQAFADIEARQRLLDGLLLRLARQPDADAFALRGGMLVRHWFPESGRVANDIDLVCALPYDTEDLRRRLHALLAESTVDDGIVFEADRFRVDRVHPDSAHPTLRLFARGRADGVFAELSVDLSFALEVWPAARRSWFSTARGSADLWLCAPEMLIARKLKVTAELGRTSWRPKDLADLWWMLRRFSPTTKVLGEAIDRTFQGPTEPPSLTASWWQEPRAVARWAPFTQRLGGSSLPRELEAVVAELGSQLAPFLRS